MPSAEHPDTHAVSQGPPRSSLRDRTRDEVYRLIRATPGELTRSALVEITGYPSSTIAHAVSRLTSEGSVVEGSPTRRPAKAGRPAAVLSLAPTGVVTGAIDFGHNHVWVAIGDDVGAVLAEEHVRIDVDSDADAALSMARDILLALAHARQVDKPAHVVVGVPGPVDQASGLIQSPSILPGWAGTAPAEYLSRHLGVPVSVENDAVLGAQGELYAGAGRKFSDFVYVKASNGVGAAIVMGGKLRRGSTGIAGEIGHIQLAGRSELCRCGSSGCLEAIVSAANIRSKLAHTHPRLDADTLRLDELHDQVTARILSEHGLVLGRVLADVANILNPAAIIVGGEVGTSGPAFIDGVRASMSRHAQPAVAQSVVVLPAELGTRAELIGGLSLAGIRALA